MGDSPKIFFDVLSDYEDLKYIFKYGFDWECKAAEIVLGKNPKTVKELERVFRDILDGRYEKQPWYRNIGNPGIGKSKKKSGRNVVWKNHYRLDTGNWYEVMYETYGSYYDSDGSVERTLRSCSHWKAYATEKNPWCLECDSKCSYSRLCRIKQEIEYFKHLRGEGFELDPNEQIQKELYGEYRDVIEKKAGKYRLRKNGWTWSENQQDSVFRDKKEYKQFSRMLRFFSQFAPMSMLGCFALRRMGDGALYERIRVKNRPFDFELEQEYIYRILCAIQRKEGILYEKREYLPLKLFYSERNLFGIPEKLFLGVKNVNGETETLSLGNGQYLERGKHLSNDEKESEYEHVTGSKKQISLLLYSNHQMGYLDTRRMTEWSGQRDREQHEALPEKRIMTSPYAPEIREWEVTKEVYEVEEQDLPGFEQFAKSFGDFAYWEKPHEWKKRKQEETYQPRKGSGQNAHSLLNIYNSDALLDSICTDLPLRSIELEWIEFILNHYPNMCRLFLEGAEEENFKQKQEWFCQCIEKELDERGETTESRKIFDSQYFEFETQMKDLESAKVKKYRRILHRIEERAVLTYEYHEKTRRMYPYAMQYDVLRHISREEPEPFEIMCYDIDQKRNVNVLCKKIQTQNTLDNVKIFTPLDKLYHILAYAVRCAAEGKEEIWPKVMPIIDAIWPMDPRGNDNYIRCIKKKWGKSSLKEYKVVYERLKQQFPENSTESNFTENVFKYWYEQADFMEDSVQNNGLWKYQELLIQCFEQGCERIGELNSALEQITEDDIWKLIRDHAMDGVPCEIAFYNENLLQANISFILKEGNRENIDRIFRLFHEFLCTGEVLDENRIRFSVTYEKFYYRKIHMLLMTIIDMVEELLPETTAEIIRKRVENKEKDAEERKNGRMYLNCCARKDRSDQRRT